MTNTDQFFVKLCPCGIVHLSFGSTVINATEEAVIAITETLKEVSMSLRQRRFVQEFGGSDEATIDPFGNVIKGNFQNH